MVVVGGRLRSSLGFPCSQPGVCAQSRSEVLSENSVVEEFGGFGGSSVESSPASGAPGGGKAAAGGLDGMF
jgi:hypothetical protein